MELPRFSHAAKCLAEVATTLSTAAQAMAVAAQALSAAGFELEKLGLGAVGCLENTSTLKRTCSCQQKPTTERADCDDPGETMPIPRTPVGDAEEYASMADNDYYMSDEDEEYISALLRRQREAETCNNTTNACPATPPGDLQSIPPASPRSVRSSPAAIPVSTQLAPLLPPSKDPEPPSRFQRHILVDLETDVIPVVCALTQRYLKVVCYMQCALPSVMVYQKIIKGATESMVYMATASNIELLRWTCKAFDMQDRAILLLPETVYPWVTTESPNLCVVHVGWPSSTERYQSQIRLLNAPYSVLVACTEDQAIYPACQRILNESSPWPDSDQATFGTLISTLCPKIQSALSKIPQDLKEQFYLDWIEAHGPHGPRHVSSWTPIILVYRANLYLLDVLRYRSESRDSGECPFPPVSEEFITRNGLKPALEKGLLNLIEQDSGLNLRADFPGDFKPDVSLSSNQKAHTETKTKPALTSATTDHSSSGAPTRPDVKSDVPMKPAASPIPNTNASKASAQSTTRTETKDGIKPSVEANPEAKTPDKSITPQVPANSEPNRPESSVKSSEPTASDEYFVVPDEFHVIPVICILAREKAYKNIICYVRIGGVMETLGTQIRAMTSKPVFFIASANSGVIPNALKAFDSPSGALVFCNAHLPLFQQLRTKPIHQIIHSGWMGKSDLYAQQVGTTGVSRNRLIITQSEYSTIPEPEQLFGALQLNLTRSTIPSVAFDPIIKQWQCLLNKSEKHLNSCFMEWIKYHGTGTYKVKAWSTLELAAQANKFAEKVLGRDGKKNGLKVSEGFVKDLKLQPAVQAGILQVQP